MTTLFVSDLHLDASRPAICAVFLEFLRDEAANADALYILGDLFEYWVGDDDPQPLAAEVSIALHALVNRGVPAYFIRGNRDFLLADRYAAQCGLQILPDPCVISLYGNPTLLLHGDLLCTQDAGYQAFRRQTRGPDWQREFLSQPLAARTAYAQRARAASAEHQQRLLQGAAPQSGAASANIAREDVTDACAATVAAVFQQYGIERMIHGHTHRPAVHSLVVDGKPRTRIVLGDWYEQGSVLRVDADGMALSTL